MNSDILISSFCIMSEFCVLYSEPKQCLFLFLYSFLMFLQYMSTVISNYVISSICIHMPCIQRDMWVTRNACLNICAMIFVISIPRLVHIIEECENMVC
jgi:hypothetical protein